MILFENKYQTFNTVFHHQTRWNTSKFVKNTPLHVVFSTLFSVFHLVMKHCISCLLYYTKNSVNAKDVSKVWVQGCLFIQPKFRKLWLENKWNRPFWFGLARIFDNTFEGGPLWTVPLVCPKWPFPFDIIVFPATAHLYPAYKYLPKHTVAWVCRVLSRIYRLGEKSRVAEGHELPRGVRVHAPPEIFWNEYALRCNLVHFETQFLRNVTVVFILFFSCNHVLTMLHLALIFFWGKLLPLKYPR